jgi:cell wall-associated NlpC family hydrolase
MRSAVRNTITVGSVGTALLLPLVTAGTASAHVSTPAPVAPAAVQAPAPAAAEQGNGTHKVKPGDTIAKIAKAYGVRWDALADLNGVKSPFVIFPNQVLKLPGGATAPAATPAPVEHTSRGADRSAPAPTPSVSSSGKGAGAVAYMFEQMRQGDRYVYGANGPSQWDCSSLTQAAWKSQGENLPRTSAAQASAGTATTRAALVPGDLVRYPGHIAMYIGNGEVIHAVNKNVGLKVTSLDWAGSPTGYRHIG